MPAPPYSCGTEHPSRPSSAICGNDRRIEAMLPIEFANPRRDLARAPLAYRLFEQPLLFGQIEIKHEDGPLIEKKTKDENGVF